MTIDDAVFDIQKHIAILNDEYGKVVQRLSTLESKVENLIWMERTILGGIIVIILGLFFKFIFERKNGKK